MSILGKKLRSIEGGRVGFMCPACQEIHVVKIKTKVDEPSPCWGYNGNPDAPTFAPSVFVRSGHYTHDRGPGNCYCDYSTRYPNRDLMPWRCTCCHFFVTEGRIQYLRDCSHALSGMTVDLPDLAFDPNWDIVR